MRRPRSLFRYDRFTSIAVADDLSKVPEIRAKGAYRAIADYQAALRIDPRFETAAENLATVQALRKRPMREMR